MILYYGNILKTNLEAFGGRCVQDIYGQQMGRILKSSEKDSALGKKIKKLKN